VIKKKEGKNNYNYYNYNYYFCYCADVVVSSIQQCGEVFLMKNVNNRSFGTNQSVMFARILVLEWEIARILILKWEINKRMIFNPGIMFLLEEVYS